MVDIRTPPHRRHPRTLTPAPSPHRRPCAESSPLGTARTYARCRPQRGAVTPVTAPFPAASSPISCAFWPGPYSALLLAETRARHQDRDAKHRPRRANRPTVRFAQPRQIDPRKPACPVSSSQPGSSPTRPCCSTGCRSLSRPRWRRSRRSRASRPRPSP